MSENNYCRNCNGTLYQAITHGFAVTIKDGIETIATEAFANQTNIKEIEFPSSLLTIQYSAFKGCSGIERAVFNHGIQTIGSKAFSDTKLKLVELPGSVRALADDAFPPFCVVVIDGEMPGYRQKLAAFAKEQAQIESHKMQLEALTKTAALIKDKLAKHISNPLDRTLEITAYKKRLNDIEQDIVNIKIAYDSVIRGLGTQLNAINETIDKLNAERKKCSVFAISRKKAIDAQILTEKESENDVKQKICKANLELSRKLELCSTEKSKIIEAMKKMDLEQKAWEETRKSLYSNLTNLEHQRNDVSKNICNLEQALAEQRAKNESNHVRWLKMLEDAREERRINELKSEKKRLISKLKIPHKKSIGITFDYANSTIDEIEINQHYSELLANKIEREFASKLNSCIAQNCDVIDRIKALNESINLQENDGIENLFQRDIPNKYSFDLPQRFLAINKYFNNEKLWKEIKSLITCYSSGIANKLFKSGNYIGFTDTKTNVLLFSYCAIVYSQDKQIKVYTYDKFRIKATFVERDCTGEPAEKDAEIINQRYTYANLDGSPNKRYKSNPIITTVRYSKIVFCVGDNDLLKYSLNNSDVVSQFTEAFDAYRHELFNGDNAIIYGLVISGKQLTEINAEISKKAQREKERKRAEIAAAKAAEAAAAQKRLELIQLQRERNEERKRQIAEQKAKSEELAMLFGDDFDRKAKAISLPEANDESTPNSQNSAIEIIGGKTISNTVFKVTLKANKMSNDELTAYFIDKSGNGISNRKIAAVSSLREETVFGFILNSGIDYSLMKKCYLRIEQNGTVIGEIEFKMNIAFSPDVF